MAIKLLLIGIVAFLVLAAPALATNPVIIAYWSTDPCTDRAVNLTSPFSMTVRVDACSGETPTILDPPWLVICEEYCDDYWSANCQECKDQVLLEQCDNVSVRVLIYYNATNASYRQDTGWIGWNTSSTIIKLDTSKFWLNWTGGHQIKIYGKSTDDDAEYDTKLLNFSVKAMVGNVSGVMAGDCISTWGTWDEQVIVPYIEGEVFHITFNVPPWGAELLYSLFCIIIAIAMFAVLKTDKEMGVSFGVILLVELLLVFLGARLGFLKWTILGVFIVVVVAYFTWKVREIFVK